jgi:hypothetical protein
VYINSKLEGNFWEFKANLYNRLTVLFCCKCSLGRNWNSEERENSPEAFNKYFLSVADEIIQDIKNKVNNNEDPEYYMSKLSQKCIPNIKLKNKSTKEIERIISSLRPTNSYGYDGISTKILKASAPFISSPLNYICNNTIISGTFPTRLKYSTV